MYMIMMLMKKEEKFLDLINFKMAQFMRENGRMVIVMGEGSSFGLMGPSMKVNGRIIWPMGKAV